jgi:hypothetical protein
MSTNPPPDNTPLPQWLQDILDIDMSEVDYEVIPTTPEYTELPTEPVA